MEKETMKLAGSALKLATGLAVVFGVAYVAYLGWNSAERRAIKKGTAV